MPLSDEAVICTWMEPKPAKDTFIASRRLGEYYRGSGPEIATDDGWWILGRRPHREPGEWYPAKLTLDTLWEVESRLSSQQWWLYGAQLAVSVGISNLTTGHALIHATPSQKIATLASVLRPELEGRK